MNLGLTSAARRTFGVLLACLMNVALAAGQATPAKKPPAPIQAAGAKPKVLLAEDVYHNIKVLRGMPLDQFLDTMGFISSSLATNCIHCHDDAIASGDPSRHKAFEIETPNMLTTRQMILMTNIINKSFFAGQQAVTCYTCHQGSDDAPKVIPELATQYEPPDDTSEPDEITRQAADAPPPDQVLDQYVQAVGGTQQLASLKSIVIKGTYQGFDTDLTPVPMDLYEKAPNMRTMVVHTAFGDRSEVFNGTAGWNAVPDSSLPKPVVDITGGRLDGEKVTAQLDFPGQIKQVLTGWRTGSPLTISGAEPGAQDPSPDRAVLVVQGFDPGRLPVKLYFDKQSGLLVRTVSYIKTAIGLIPAQVDYSNFKDVDGIKFPFHWVATWTDGQSFFNVTSLQINVPIEDAKFAKPAPPKLLTPTSAAQ